MATSLATLAAVALAVKVDGFFDFDEGGYFLNVPSQSPPWHHGRSEVVDRLRNSYDG